MKNFFKILTPNKILLMVISLSLSFAGMSLASLKFYPQDQDSQSVVQDTLKDKLDYPPNNDSLAEILYDHVAPYFKYLYPQPGQKDVPRNSFIKFTVCDTLVDDISKSGVDTSSIYITIESRLWGVQKVRPDTIVILDPEYYFVSCVYHPRNLFDFSDTVLVYLEASDLSARPEHNHGDTTFTFYTIKDTIAPELIPIYPLPDMIEVPIDSGITIRGTDVGRGVNFKNVKLVIKGSPVMPDTVTGDPWEFEISRIPDDGWLYDDSIHVICEVHDLDGNTDILDYWFKTPAPPLPPQLVSPVNGTDNLDIPVTMVWRRSEGANSYRLQVSLDSLFSKLVFDGKQLVDSSQTVSKLVWATTYYWRANASNEHGTSDWSAVWHFRTCEMVVLSDLFVLNFISSAGENEIDVNTQVSLEAHITCVNNSCSDSFAVSFYLDDNEQPFALFWIDGLYDGEVRLVNPSIQISSTGIHKVNVFVDCYNNIHEENEENNIAEVTIEVRIKYPRLIVRSNPFTPNDDGFNDEVEFNFEQFDVENPNLKIFDMHGKKVREFDIPNNKRFIWNGSDSNRTPLLPGIYLYIFSERNKAIARGCIVIAR